MSYLGPSHGPDDWHGQKTNAERRDIERAAEQRDILSQAERSGYAPRRQRVSDRIRRMFSRGAAPSGSDDADLPEEQVWERERQRRREYEQDRSNRGE
jgi:hypothetical protein